MAEQRMSPDRRGFGTEWVETGAGMPEIRVPRGEVVYGSWGPIRPGMYDVMDPQIAPERDPRGGMPVETSHFRFITGPMRTR